jgi:hypothetical protein
MRPFRHLAGISLYLATHTQRDRRESAAYLAADLFPLGGGEVEPGRMPALGSLFSRRHSADVAGISGAGRLPRGRVEVSGDLTVDRPCSAAAITRDKNSSPLQEFQTPTRKAPGTPTSTWQTGMGRVGNAEGAVPGPCAPRPARFHTKRCAVPPVVGGVGRATA